MALVVLLNGPPAVGKSALAYRWVRDRPLALVVDIDRLRTTLGDWMHDEASKGLARDLGLALVDAQLAKGHDVIVPQYVGRTEWIERFERAARRRGARFVEILLLDELDVIAERFRSRRRSFAEADRSHPSDEIPDDRIDDEIAAALGSLDFVRAVRPATRVVHAGRDLDETSRLLSKEVQAALAADPVTETLIVRWNAVCIDALDAEALAAFYCGLLGYEVVVLDGGWCQLADPRGGMTISIQGETWYRPPVWPERQDELSKMLHMEMEVTDVEAAVARAVQLGAVVARPQPTDRDPAKLRVMLDPAGHPFCLWAP